MIELTREGFLDALELLGESWSKHERPIDILGSRDKLRMLLKIEDIVNDRASGLSADDVIQWAPSFVEQFRLITLREI